MSSLSMMSFMNGVNLIWSKLSFIFIWVVLFFSVWGLEPRAWHMLPNALLLSYISWVVILVLCSRNARLTPEPGTVISLPLCFPVSLVFIILFLICFWQYTDLQWEISLGSISSTNPEALGWQEHLVNIKVLSLCVALSGSQEYGGKRVHTLLI